MQGTRCMDIRPRLQFQRVRQAKPDLRKPCTEPNNSEHHCEIAYVFVILFPLLECGMCREPETLGACWERTVASLKTRGTRPCYRVRLGTCQARPRHLGPQGCCLTGASQMALVTSELGSSCDRTAMQEQEVRAPGSCRALMAEPSEPSQRSLTPTTARPE